MPEQVKSDQFSLRDVWEGVTTLLKVLWSYIRDKNWFHPVVLVLPLWLFLSWRVGSWKLGLIGMAGELWSHGWHTNQHHPTSWFAHPVVRIVAITSAFLTALSILHYGL